jgi:hypothetical protein
MKEIDFNWIIEFILTHTIDFTSFLNVFARILTALVAIHLSLNLHLVLRSTAS